MKGADIFNIGSATGNNIVLSGAAIAPFHLTLYKDSTGQVWVAARTAQFPYELNGEKQYLSVPLQAGDQLVVESNHIAWTSLFDIQETELRAQKSQIEAQQTAQKGLRLQLVLIYLAVLILLFLMAFYI